MNRPLHSLLALLLALSAGTAFAWDGLPAKNESTLARSFALPALGAHRVFAPDESHVGVSYDMTNEYVFETAGNETLTLDGETSKFNFSYRAGFADRFEYRIELPVLIVGGGYTDGFIEDWHTVFGLPNGGRERVPRDRRLYQYNVGGSTRLNESDSTTTLGDLLIGAGWQATDRLALRGQLKLPTGDSDRLTGGNWGAAFWADWGLPFGEKSHWDGFLSGGVTFAEGKGALESQQKNYAVFGGAGLAYHFIPRLQAFVQLYSHTALYDNSALDAFTQPGLQIAFGGAYRITPKVQLQAYVQEDPIVSSSPDFSIHIGLTVR